MPSGRLWMVTASASLAVLLRRNIVDKQEKGEMYNIPVNEKELLGSLPGFKLLTLEEMLNIQVISFEYSDHMALTTVTLLFRYGIIPLKFELSCSRQDGFCYEHVLYEEEFDEKEFPGFREAVDYIKLKAKTDGTAQMDK